MKKNTKITIIALSFILVASVGFLSVQSDLFQGRLNLFNKNVKVPTLDLNRVFMHKGQIISLITSKVTSPVTSVIVSNVTSRNGTSRVASAVTSPVTSPVSSKVKVPKNFNAGGKKITELTASTLKSIEKADYLKNPQSFLNQAKIDYKKNPSKFTLPKSQQVQMINLYKTKYPSQFKVIKK